MQASTPQAVIVELCKLFYGLGWVTGTGGGISLREGGRVYMAPSGVQKERIVESDIYVMDEKGGVLEAPANTSLSPSECAPLFFKAFELRDAGAVIHSHGMEAMLVTLRHGERFACTQLEMIKGIEGHGFFDTLEVPIVDNTARERELADRMAAAIEAYPKSRAVLVRRHGVYIWGRDWVQAKTHAECYHYLFEASLRMAAMGVDAAETPAGGRALVHGGLDGEIIPKGGKP
ncbi:MAG: methylthioribulose 1-phosphate dehydratase [Myxococcales bacterium]|nr:methylthioribulose 1-phosphate dehydratase [Myxococcales bacterium]